MWLNQLWADLSQGDTLLGVLQVVAMVAGLLSFGIYLRAYLLLKKTRHASGER